MDLIANHITVTVLLVVGVAGVMIWQQVPEPEAPRPALAAAEEWLLLASAKQNTEADLKKSADAILSRNLWGVVTAAPDPASTAPQWRVLGVFRRGAERYVVVKDIKDRNKPAQNLKVGDALPSGDKILAIQDDRLTIAVNGKKQTLTVYRQ